MGTVQPINPSVVIPADFEPPVISADDPPIPTIRDITHAVSKFYDIPVTAIVADRREARIVRARQITYHLCLTLSLRSSAVIGRLLGDKDHTTILHGAKKIRRLIRENPRVLGEINILRRALGHPPETRPAPTAVPIEG